MKDETADLLNRRARMTPEERDRDIVKGVMGSLLDSVFPLSNDLPWHPTEDDDEQ